MATQRPELRVLGGLSGYHVLNLVFLVASVATPRPDLGVLGGLSGHTTS